MITEFLYKNSDENNPLSSTEIIAYLNEKQISIDPKTLKTDVALLIEMGYDVVEIKGKGSPNRFFWGERLFETPELKMLLDAISSAHFISEKKSCRLIGKLISQASIHQKLQLEHYEKVYNRSKTDNENLYYIIDAITEAIDRRNKISFQYMEYNVRKEKVFRNNGQWYVLSPYMLYWNEDYYYVVGYSDKRESIAVFRVDRIYKVNVMEEAAVEVPSDFNAADYSGKIFAMFGGRERQVTLECENSLMKYVIDRFGVNVDTREWSENTFLLKVPVVLSPTFYGWVFQFAGKIVIRKPEEAVREYEAMKKL